MKSFFQTHLKKVVAIVHFHPGTRGDVAPARDWYLALACSGALLLVFVSLGVYQYFRASDAIGVEPDTSVEVIDVDLGSVQALVAAYRVRREEFEALQKVPPPTPDVGGSVAEVPAETVSEVSIQDATSTTPFSPVTAD